MLMTYIGWYGTETIVAAYEYTENMSVKKKKRQPVHTQKNL